MIVGGIVAVNSLPHEAHEKIAVDAFIVMQRNKIQVIQSKYSGD